MRLAAVVTFLALATLACAAPGGDDGDDKGGGGLFGGGDGDDSGEDAPSYTWSDVLIDFDELDRDMDVSTEYPEVTFEAERGYTLNSWNYPSYSRSEPNSAYTAASPGGAGASVDLTWTFAAPVRNLAFYTLGDQIDGPLAKIDVTLEDGTEDTVNLVGDGGAGTAEKCDLTDYENVVSITIRDMEDPYTVNIDDISFAIRGEE